MSKNFGGKKGKLRKVGLHGASSTCSENAPEDIKNYRISRIKEKSDYFIYTGQINGEPCKFKIDTGSDISIVNEKLIKKSNQRILIKNNFLKYPTGERVPIKYKIKVKIDIGKFSEEIEVFVADIVDECLLGVDFLLKVGLEEIFYSVFKVGTNNGFKELECARVVNFEEKVPHKLEDLYKKNNLNLNEAQKKDLVEFLEEFQDVFSEEIVAGNCNVIEHQINLKESNPIKQTPRRIPIHMRGEVDKIIEEMKCQGVIEESCSPWVSPVVLVKKKRWFNSFLCRF